MCCRVKPWASFFTLYYFSSLGYILVNVYLAIDSGGYLCTNSLCALIAASLGASHRSRNDVPLNRFAREKSVNSFVFEQS